MIPYEANTRINSDSKVAIEEIQNFKDLISIRTNFKTKNYSLISQIINCYKSKRINLKLIKVKSYSMNL